MIPERHVRVDNRTSSGYQYQHCVKSEDVKLRILAGMIQPVVGLWGKIFCT